MGGAYLSAAVQQKGNQGIHIQSVTPYIPRTDGAKEFLAGACEFFCNLLIHTKDKTGIYVMVGILFINLIL